MDTLALLGELLLTPSFNLLEKFVRPAEFVGPQEILDGVEIPLDPARVELADAEHLLADGQELRHSFAAMREGRQPDQHFRGRSRVRRSRSYWTGGPARPMKEGKLYFLKILPATCFASLSL